MLFAPLKFMFLIYACDPTTFATKHVTNICSLVTAFGFRFCNYITFGTCSFEHLSCILAS